MANILEQIQKMIEDGFSRIKISILLNINFTELNRIVKENKFIMKADIFSEDKIPHIIELYKSGVSAKALGKKYSIDKRRVQKWVKTEGVLRTKKEAGRSIKFNENKFDTIDTREKAYWLGFCYADAYNYQTKHSKFSLTLATKDYDHVVKFCNFMEIDVNQIATHSDGHTSSSGVRFYSKYLCTQMAKLGCPQAKSFIIKFPQWLDKNLYSHFIRGMFDGDGCLRFNESNKEWRWSLVSTKECCEDIKNIFFNTININIDYDCISKTNNNTYDLLTGGNEKVKTILDWLHKDSEHSIRLTRKYEDYLKLVDQQNNRKVGREKYFVPKETIELIKLDLSNGLQIQVIADKYGFHRKTIWTIKSKLESLENIEVE